MEKITSFQILDLTMAGFKSYQEPVTYTFGNPTLITGGNGRGKSTIADAIAFAITGVPFFGERGIDRLHCDDAESIDLVLRFADQNGTVHQLGRNRKKDRMTITLDGNPVRQLDLTNLFGEKDVFLSIFNPLYFIEELGENGKNLLARILPAIPHETILEQLPASCSSVVATQEFLEPSAHIKDLREQIRDAEEYIVYTTGQRDLADTQRKQLGETLTKMRQDVILVSQKLSQLQEQQFAGLDPDAMAKELAACSSQYEAMAKGHDTSPGQEIAKLELARETRKQEQYQSKFTEKIAQMSATLTQLLNQYQQEQKIAKSIQVGFQCPTCHRPVSQGELPYMANSFQQTLQAIAAQGKELRGQLEELHQMDQQCHEKFLEFQQEDLEALTQQLAELSQPVSQEHPLEQLRLQIQQLTTTLQRGNLTAGEYDQLLEYQKMKAQLESDVSAMEIVSAEEYVDYEATLTRVKEEIASIQKILPEMVAYISKKMELTFSALTMNRVKISLYDVVKSTGELKDVFRFTYLDRRYDKLSLSEKIRAGMEVSQLIGRLTDRSYPVFVDNMESVDDLANIRPAGQILMAKCVHNAPLLVTPKGIHQPEAKAA